MHTLNPEQETNKLEIMHINNRRTTALLSVGVLSYAAIAHAEEKLTPISTAVSSTVISGYVDTSAQWNFGTGNLNNPPYAFGGSTKADGFNLNVVQLSIAKPLDESAWASGYNVDLWLGPDANTLASQSNLANGTSDFAIRQAYVALRTPVGNNIDWKIGVFDTCIGYEVLASGNNPNFTRSYGFSLEPTTHTGLEAAYQFTEWLSVVAGVADTVGPTINGRAFPTSNSTGGDKAESYKTYLGSITLTAPKEWGWASGSTLTAGVVNGYSSSYGDNESSWYVGTTLATPLTGLKVGAAFDYLDVHNSSSATPGADGNTWVIGGYASYQATEKLSFHGRGEYVRDEAYYFSDKPKLSLVEFTGTIQYDLWKNVLSRVEFRWDHSDNGNLFGGDTEGDPNRENAYVLLANFVYKF
jgi:hypothetical protein